MFSLLLDRGSWLQHDDAPSPSTPHPKLRAQRFPRWSRWRSSRTTLAQCSFSCRAGIFLDDIEAFVLVARVFALCGPAIQPAFEADHESSVREFEDSEFGVRHFPLPPITPLFCAAKCNKTVTAGSPIICAHPHKLSPAKTTGRCADEYDAAQARGRGSEAWLQSTCGACSAWEYPP